MGRKEGENGEQGVRKVEETEKQRARKVEETGKQWRGRWKRPGISR